MIGGQEIVIVGVVIVLLFGAKRLPELGRSIGETIKEFKKSSKGLLDDDDGEKSEKASKPGS